MVVHKDFLTFCFSLFFSLIIFSVSHTINYFSFVFRISLISIFSQEKSN